MFHSAMGIPWWSSAQDSALSLLWAQVLSSIRELLSRKAHRAAKKKKVCSTASQKKLQQNYPNPNAFTRKSTCVCFLLTSPKIINNRISSNSWNLAGGEQHSELIHI